MRVLDPIRVLSQETGGQYSSEQHNASREVYVDVGSLLHAAAPNQLQNKLVAGVGAWACHLAWRPSQEGCSGGSDGLLFSL
jgi:hypothetical protein